MEKEKALHPRNIHNQEYEFDVLAAKSPELLPFITKNQYDDLSVNFSDPNAVLALNQALLLHHYEVKGWTIPKGHLCPPIPGRADYLHYIADLITEEGKKCPPVGVKIKGLDIGTGTGCIYPILGNSIYGWKFVGTDVDTNSINHCKMLLRANPTLKKNIKLRFQESIEQIFEKIILPGEFFDFTMCNPPFYSSISEARSATDRKVKNLNKNKIKKGHDDNKIKSRKASNFGGKNHELWYPGGEISFIKKMIEQSIQVKDQCRWFTTLVSNKALLPELQLQLEKLKCAEVRTIEMQQGQKIAHILAWRINHD